MVNTWQYLAICPIEINAKGEILDMKLSKSTRITHSINTSFHKSVKENSPLNSNSFTQKLKRQQPTYLRLKMTNKLDHFYTDFYSIISNLKRSWFYDIEKLKRSMQSKSQQSEPIDNAVQSRQ